MASQLYDIPEVMRRLKTSKDTVYRLIAAGDLESCDIAPPGSKAPKTRVSDEAIERFIAARTRKAKAPHIAS